MGDEGHQGQQDGDDHHVDDDSPFLGMRQADALTSSLSMEVWETVQEGDLEFVAVVQAQRPAVLRGVAVDAEGCLRQEHPEVQSPGEGPAGVGVVQGAVEVELDLVDRGDGVDLDVEGAEDEDAFVGALERPVP